MHNEFSSRLDVEELRVHSRAEIVEGRRALRRKKLGVEEFEENWLLGGKN